MIQDVSVPRVLSQASAYDVAPVIEQTRAINMKVYAEIAPIATTRAVAGMRALGAFPKAAIPGRNQKEAINAVLARALEMLCVHVLYMDEHI